MLGEGHRRHERGTDVVVGFVETHGRAAHRGAGRRPRGRPAPHDDLPRRRRSPRWTSTRSSPADPRWCWSTSSRTPTCRARATTSAGRTSRSCSPPASPCCQHGQHPAPGVAQRRRREDHRRAAARDRPGRGRPGRRPGRTRRHHPGGAAPPDGARKHLRPRQGRRRARPLLPGRQPHRAARARAAVAGRQGRRGAAALPPRAPHRGDLGDPRARSWSRSPAGPRARR